MIASGNGVGVGVGAGGGVTVRLGVGEGEAEGGGLNFGPGQPARRRQMQTVKKLCSRLSILQHSNTPTLRRFEDEDDDEFEDESKLLGRLRNRMDLLLMD
jgi:hypothetical protein